MWWLQALTPQAIQDTGACKTKHGAYQFFDKYFAARNFLASAHALRNASTATQPPGDWCDKSTLAFKIRERYKAHRGETKLLKMIPGDTYPNSLPS